MPAAPASRVNPVRARRPVLQNCHVDELCIDAAYQRSIDNGSSRALIAAIARDWDWSLCLPLVVARRSGGDGVDELFVVDGQHRLEAARMRGDILDLPCVITAYADAAGEAATFVQLNRQRRPLTAMDLFKAALASGDVEAIALHAMIRRAGLSLAPHKNVPSWKPGEVFNIAGIQKVQKRYGDAVTARALQQLARAWPGQVLQYAATIFPGIAATIGELGRDVDMDMLQMVLEGATQPEWMRDIQCIELDREVHRTVAATRAIREAYDEAAAA